MINKGVIAIYLFFTLLSGVLFLMFTRLEAGVLFFLIQLMLWLSILLAEQMEDEYGGEGDIKEVHKNGK